MDEKCHKAQEIDLALFLLESQGSEWQEFRAHYPHCVICSSEVQKWTSLEHRLRAMGNVGAALHPSAEALVQFQQKSHLLPSEEQQKIDVHLRSCPACHEEVKLLGSFDFSLVQQWAGETKIVVAGKQASWSTRFWDALRSLFFHPAFAYGLVLLLAVPFIRSYYSASRDNTPISSNVASPSPSTAREKRPEAKLEQEARVEEGRDSQTLPQVTASAPVRLQPPSEKAKEDVPPAKLAKQSSRRENLALKDERAPVSSPASPAPSIAAGGGARDTEIPTRQKRSRAEEEKQQAFSEPSVPAIAAEGRIGSTEMRAARKNRREEKDTAPASAERAAPPQAAALARSDLARRYNSTQAALIPLTDIYKDAYEARDLNALGKVWAMDQSWRKALRQLFTKSQRITVSLDFDEGRSTISENQQQIFAPLVQSVTVVQDGQVSTHGPFFCLADIRQQSTGMWKIHELQEDPQHPGRCRLQ